MDRGVVEGARSSHGHGGVCPDARRLSGPLAPGSGPGQEGGEESAETLLQALGLPSRAQVVGVARQLAEVDDRLERLEDGIAVLLRRRDGKEPQ